MCLKIFSFTFLVLAIYLTMQMIALMSGVTNKMRPMESSKFISSIAAVMLGYVINAFLLMLFIPQWHAKVIFLAFGIMPFLIGNVATYQKLKLFSILQTICVIMSGVYILVV